MRFFFVDYKKVFSIKYQFIVKDDYPFLLPIYLFVLNSFFHQHNEDIVSEYFQLNML